MNIMSGPITAVAASADVGIYDAEAQLRDKVTKITINTLSNNRLGLAGSIAYVDNGAELYENFKRSHDEDPSQSTTARLISVHKQALLDSIHDIERLIIIGGGSYESVKSQELALINGLYSHGQTPNLKEVILIDVSADFLLESERAVKEFSDEHGSDLRIIPIRADFKDVSGSVFDRILEAQNTTSRDQTKAAILMTGATFGNIESVSSTEKFPGNEVDEQMAHLADLVGIGSTVMFDHFTKINTGENYYNTPELSAFFNNIPVLMQKYCKGLEDFHPNEDGENEPYFRYRARPLYNARMIAHELVAQIPQRPRIVNGTTREYPLAVGDTLNVMFSLQARAEDIASRPTINTGLDSQMSVTHKDLQVMHVFKKIGNPAALPMMEETSHQTVKPQVVELGGSIAVNACQKLAGATGALGRLIFRPLAPSRQPQPLGF